MSGVQKKRMSQFPRALDADGGELEVEVSENEEQKVRSSNSNKIQIKL